jgi:hypothetical protein
MQHVKQVGILTIFQIEALLRPVRCMEEGVFYVEVGLRLNHLGERRGRRRWLSTVRRGRN